jgi:hypothetical protein
MPVVEIPGSPAALERLKFEYAEYRIGDDCGQRGPRVFEEFPKAMYRAGRDSKNQIDILGMEVAGDADEESKLFGKGLRHRQEDAIALAEANEREFAKLAANRAHNDRKLSENAQAEARAYEESVTEHVAEVPETPIKRRGRPRKVTE